MSNNSTSSTAQKLLQAFSNISSTEDFIVYVASADNMLSFCQNLIEKYDHDHLSPVVMEFKSLCAARGILPGLLFSEIRKVLIALNRFHDSDKDHYATLGVPENAALEEIKKAYRQLSKQYHPDTSANTNPDSQQRFMEIAGAYHAIMTSSNTDATTPTAVKLWRKKGRRHGTSRSQRKRNFLLTLISIIVVLVGLSLYISGKYDEQVALSQIEDSSLAAPDEKILDRLSKDTFPPLSATEPVPQLPAEKAAKEDESEHSIARTEPEKTLPQSAPEETFLSGNEIRPEFPRSHDETVFTKKPVKVETEPSEPDQILAKVEPFKSETPAQQKAPPEEENPEPVKVTNQAPEPESMQNSAYPKVAEKPAPTRQKETAHPLPVGTKETSSSQDHITTAASITAVQQNTNRPEALSVQQVVPEKKKIKVIHEKIREKDLKSSIENILSQYANSYSTKNLEQMLIHFHRNARENGHLQSELIDRYRSLFTHTETIELSLGPIRWHENNSGIEAKCSFKADYTYKDGQIRDHIGEIKFYLTSEEGALKIKSLDYVFVN